MRKRTPSEIKAYGDGYAEAYKEFCHLLDRHDKDKAVRKMKIFADAVALTVETATDTADTPQTEEKHAICNGCVYCDLPNAFHPCASCVDFSKYVGEESGDTPQTDCPYDDDDKCFGCGDDTKCVAFDTPQTDCGWK